MATYNSELAKIQRQRAIADALRASGNEPMPASIRTGGRFDAPVSGWEHANRALSQILGAYSNRQADKKQEKLDQEDKAVMSSLVDAKRAAEAPDVNQELDPALQSDEGPTRVPDASKPLTKAERQAKMQAAVMRGLEFGGSAGPFAQEITKREILPAEQTPYTLGANDQRRDKDNKIVAVGEPPQFRESAEDRQLVNIVDAKSPKGYKTIKRADWNGEQLYEKPNQSAVTANLLTGNGLDLAAEQYRQTGKIPPGLGRSPQAVMKIIDRAMELASSQGDTAQIAVLRQSKQKAAQSALTQLTKQQTAVGSFEKTARNSLKIAQDLSNKVNRAGVPVFDRWIQAGKKKVLGDPDTASFHAANETFVTEYAKIMSGSMGNTVTSDSAREHARDLLSPAYTKEEYDAVVATLVKEMEGRLASFPAQAAELMGMLSATDENPQGGAAGEVVNFGDLK